MYIYYIVTPLYSNITLVMQLTYMTLNIPVKVTSYNNKAIKGCIFSTNLCF